MAVTSDQLETVIGLEVHVQLITNSKMFCSCSSDYAGAEPNTHVCPVCLGLPGVLPVINEEAIRLIIAIGLSLNCTVSGFSKFDRKNYLYPDQMKGYQISQFDLPICENGWQDIEVDDAPFRCGITRVHMEEDTARLLHRKDPQTGNGYSLVDINRSGVPLVEIVSEPDFRSPEQARAYLVTLRQLLRMIGASNANMEEGNFRCDANISLRTFGDNELGTKVEIKNMNSFRSVYDGLRFEQVRQAKALNDGEKIVQETRGWKQEKGITVSQRIKEEANDYRYFPEPDLPPLTLSNDFVESIRNEIPELPLAKRERFVALGLNEFEAATLSEDRARANYFDSLVLALEEKSNRAAKLAANWMLGEVARWDNEHVHEDLSDFPIAVEALTELILLAEDGVITSSVAKQVFESMIGSGLRASQIVEENGLAQMGEDAEGELVQIVLSVIDENDKALSDYLAGKSSALKFLLGQVMRQTKGRADHKLIQTLLETELKALE